MTQPQRVFRETVDPAPIIVMGAANEPTAAQVLERAANEGEWTFPLEAVLQLTSPALKETVFKRCEAGDPCKRQVKVFARGDRLFGQIEFQHAHWLLLPMDVWLKPKV